jgi:hypothetical protein
MYLSDATTRYCRVALYSQHHRDGCARRSAHELAGVTEAERARQLRLLRLDHTITGQCWNPR